MTFGSLFSGIGGIDLGLERAGMQCKWQVEIDPFATKVLAARWPEVTRYGDIKTVGKAELEPVDLIAGGFPCQDLSQAGKRAGIEGARSGLWFEYARIIGELRPRYVLIENVPGLLVYDGMQRVLGELSRRGYDAVWFSVRASEFGASHLRKRVFIVAYASGSGTPVNTTAGTMAKLSQPEGSDVADSASGGRGELRESSGSNGLVNRSHAELADAHERDGREFPQPDFGTVARADGESRGDMDDPASASGRREQQAGGARIGRPGSEGAGGAGGALDNPAWHEQSGLSREGGRMRRRGIRETGECLADPAIARLEIGRDQARDSRETLGYPTVERAGAFAPGPADPRWPAILRERPDLAPSLESPLRGMADGISDWLDRAMQDRTKRLSRLGNAVVPQIAEWIGRQIIEAGAVYAPSTNPEQTR